MSSRRFGRLSAGGFVRRASGQEERVAPWISRLWRSTVD
ncbi:unnamed protein product [Musa textilis]